MTDFGAGWRRYWQTFELGFWQVVGFLTAMMVFNIVGDVIGGVLKAVWQASR